MSEDTEETTPPPPVKPGYATTEFWLSLAATLLTTLFASGALTNNTALAIAGMAATVLTALGYKVSRTLVKRGAALLVAIGLGLAMTPACATVKEIPGAAKVAVIECAKQDAKPILALVAELATQAALAAMGVGHIDWEALEVAAAGQGKITGGCALTRFVAELAKRRAPTTESGTSVQAISAHAEPEDEGQLALARLSARFDGVTWQ